MTRTLGVLLALLFRHLFVPLYYAAILEMKRITIYYSSLDTYAWFIKTRLKSVYIVHSG